jgi:hypothetical protein
MAKNFKEKARRLFKRVIWIFFVGFIIVFIGFKYVKSIYIYSDGYRAGLLQKFSHKGTIFKTYEGEMILSSVISTNNVALASEKFLFSVKDPKTANLLDTLQGQFVRVHYIQKMDKFPWQGETAYFVDSVKLMSR